MLPSLRCDLILLRGTSACIGPVAYVHCPPLSGVHPQVVRARKVGRRRMQECFQAVQCLPALVITGARDRCGADLVLLLIALRLLGPSET